MSLNLNKMTQDVIERLLKNHHSQLAGMLAAPVPENSPRVERERYARGVANYSFDLGAMLYEQEGDTGEIREHLRRAATMYLRQLEIRGNPEPDEYRSPWDFGRALALVVVFGDAGQRRAIANLGKSKYYTPTDKENETYGEYLELVQEYLRTGTVDRGLAMRMEARASSDTASKEEAQLLLPQIHALQAIIDTDVARWDESLKQLVKAHEVEAKKGDYKKSTDGMMALPAMMLAKLGMERGMATTVKSPYVPLAFVRG
jgi:hypothetical protein